MSTSLLHSILFLLIIGCNSQVQVINVTTAYTTGSISCSSSGYTECIINCQATHSCGCSTGSTMCGATVSCPQSNIPCTINCFGYRVCYYGTFHGKDTSLMTVNVGGGNQAMRGAFIYAPATGGDLKVNVMPDAQLSYATVFKQVIIQTNSGVRPNNIHIICDNPGDGACEQIKIYGDYATGLVFLECINGGNCWQARVDSPHGDGLTYINCDYGTSTDVADDICHELRIDQRDTNTDLRIYCDTTTGSNACDDTIIKCSGGDCYMNPLNGQLQWECVDDGTPTPDCFKYGLPTISPTHTPTISPIDTAQPTLLPTTKQPTSIPTISPTTIEPTKSPTNQPTNPDPTTSPTKQPTSIPSESPTTKEPTKSPTNAPTSMNPTKSPTQNPVTLVPSTSPITKEPTTAEPTPKYPTTGNPSQSPTTSVPTTSPITKNPTISPVTKEPTTSNPTQYPLTMKPTSNPTTNPITKTTDRILVVPGQDTKTTDGSNNSETTKAKHLDDDKNNNDDLRSNDKSPILDMIYYIIGAVVFCCIIICVLIYCAARKKKQKECKSLETKINGINVSGLKSTTSHIMTVSKSPRSMDGMVSTFDNALCNLSAGNDIVMNDIINHMSTPMGPEPVESNTEQIENIFKGENEMDIPPPPPIYGKVETMQSFSMQSKHSHFEIEMIDMMTPNGFDAKPPIKEKVNINELHELNMDPTEDDDDDDDVVLPTKGGNNIGHDEFIIEGDDEVILRETMDGYKNEGDYEHNIGVHHNATAGQ